MTNAVSGRRKIVPRRGKSPFAASQVRSGIEEPGPFERRDRGRSAAVRPDPDHQPVDLHDAAGRMDERRELMLGLGQT